MSLDRKKVQKEVNMGKTPMPVEAMMNQDVLYIPISVLTNGLRLQVTWDKTKQTFLIQQ
ncbi:copper amine oxidase N-terminal domain-containing protein (plasmid) [Peribacillus asahii]|nr:stalk domain-containing protein [Peribacillus asahii]USK62467.1 copper amine oxidase N-terminal domain-containing protein [Peribacillus asahii]